MRCRIGLLEALIVAGALAALIAASGCGRKPAPVAPPPVVVEIVQRSCLETMPPYPRPAPEAAELEVCEGWGFCASPAAAAALERWVRLALLWMGEVEVACSEPATDEGEIP
jgi:hypothetical protein